MWPRHRAEGEKKAGNNQLFNARRCDEAHLFGSVGESPVGAQVSKFIHLAENASNYSYDVELS